MGLALSGLASGFDWKSIVDQLIEVSRAPQNRMRKEQSANATKTAALNDVKSLLSSLKSSLSSLSSTEALQKKSATFSDSTTDWTANADATTPSGTYEFELISKAETARLTGNGGIANEVGPDLPLSTISTGFNITAGTITVNGVKITIPDLSSTPAPTIRSVLNSFPAAGVSAGYNSVTDKIELTSTGIPPQNIVLGAANDTSNFLQAMRLKTPSPASSTTESYSTLGSPLLTSPLSSANLRNWNLAWTGGRMFINEEPIDYTSGESIQDILNKINNSAAGVTASFDISSGKFILTNKVTGNIGISVEDEPGGGRLAYALGFTDIAGSQISMDPADRGADAEFKINGGGSLFSRSNTLDASVHRITGLSVTANSTGIETISVGSDTTAAKSAINGFIEKYNAVQAAIEKYTKVTVDGTNVTSAVLAGSRELASISRELRRTLYAAGTDSSGNPLTGTVKRLSDIGVGFSGIENTISITNSATLDNRLASDSDDIIDYFNTNNNGLVDRLDAMLDRLVSTSSTTPGTFQVQLDSIGKQNKSLDKQIEEVERRLESQRALLESSFIAMERAQSGFQQQSAYLARTFSGNSK
jgi:flagellar hook-associated protein 2